MSEEQDTSPASASETPEAAPARVRRISNPRPKKTAAKAAGKTAAAPIVVEAPAAPAAPKEEKSVPAAVEAPAPETREDWPDAETVSESGGKGGNDKRKRRRRKGKGGGQNSQQGAPLSEEVVSHSEAPSTSGGNDAGSSAPAQMPAAVQAPRPQQQHRQQVGPEELAKRAWKIFLAEVSEEGVSLISDQDARELSKRCFRLAEIFLDEQARKLR